MHKPQMVRVLEVVVGDLPVSLDLALELDILGALVEVDSVEHISHSTEVLAQALFRPNVQIDKQESGT